MVQKSVDNNPDQNQEPEFSEHASVSAPSRVITWAPRFTVVGAVLTGLALILSLIQIKQSLTQLNQSKIQLEQSQKTEQNIREIANSVSTKYLDVFPGTMKPIINLIASTKKELLIVADVPAYGSFSSPSDYQQYTQEIENLASRSGDPKQVRILTWGPDRRHASFNLLYGSRTFEEIEKGETYKNYFDYWKQRTKPENMDGLFHLSEDENQKFQRRFLDKGVDINQTNGELPVFMWLSDDRQAIFSLYYYGGNAREVSFRTYDPRLIEVLKEIATDGLRNSNKYAAVAK
jgi:hypothetical protein